MSFKSQATLPQGQLHNWQETQAPPSRGSSGEGGGLHMNLCAYICMCMCVLHVH